MTVAALVLAVTLPAVIPDPRRGPSPWQLVGGESPPARRGAAGYLVEFPAPPGRLDQEWLQRVVGLAARGVPVVLLAREPPPEVVLPHVDAAALDPAPPPAEIPTLRGRLGGLPLVLPADDAAQAVTALAAGASAVLMADPPAGWAAELAGLVPAPAAARHAGSELPTAMREPDLASVVGLPRGFAGGKIVLPGPPYTSASLSDDAGTHVLERGADPGLATVDVPPLARSAVLVALRPGEAAARLGVVEVAGERLPSAAEVLARHQRAAARQQRLVPRWSAEQRLLLRVWVTELSRSFEVVLEGPAFWELGTGSDWEIGRAWVDGVRWDPDDLPDLPLIEPRRPRVPPLALRLEPSYRYELAGTGERDGRRCYELTFASRARPDRARRHGEAWIDAATFGLVELQETAEGLGGDVRSSSSVTRYTRFERAGESVWLPTAVSADDLVAAFGSTVAVHRELTLSGVALDPPGFSAARSATYARPHRMFRDEPSGVVPLVPDGRGGRVAGQGTPAAQRFLIAGVVSDPGLSFPLPFGGLQVQDFHFRGRDEQVRALLAGVVNDAAWSARRGKAEVSLRAFTQFLPFTSRIFVAGRERKGEEIEMQRQRLGVGAARSFGPLRVRLDAGVDRLDFGRASDTAPLFRLPADTFEGVARVEAEGVFGGATFSASAERGWRRGWHAWGLPEDGPARPDWTRGRLFVVRETNPFPLATLHLDAELLGGSGLDRFSAFSPGRFTGVSLRGIATDRVFADRLAVVRASLAVPLGPRLRAGFGVDAAWARDRFSGYEARPLSGAALSLTAPGPWRTLMRASLGFPIATPGPRAPTFELFLLRPLRRADRPRPEPTLPRGE